MSDPVTNEPVSIVLNGPPEGEDEQQTDSTNNNVAARQKQQPPFLRVEQLRDEDGNSSVYTSEEEGGRDDEEGRGKSPEPEFVPPDNELKDKIINQVEFYFSDANILKDAFLLKHVRRNKLGYVSIKLITSFKKVKSLTKDYRVVAFSLRQSEALDVNEEGKKVRRKEPLPEYDETTPSRSVVAVNLPMETPSIETVAELFSKCGEISLIRILRPGKPIPQDVKKHAAKHTEIGTTICAVVEFERHESAQKACETLTNTDDWRKGMHVVLLAKKKDKRESKDHEDGDADSENTEKKKKRREKRKKNRVDQLANDSPYASSGSEAEPQAPRHHQKSLSPNHLDPARLSPSNSPRSSPGGSPMTSPRSRRRNQHGRSPLTESKSNPIHTMSSLSPGGSPRHSPRSSPETSRKRYDYSSGGDSTPSSPWVQRRMKAAQELSPLASNRSSPGRSPDGKHRLLDMEGVVRHPKGPDGTRGFHFGRGKPRSSTFS